jgi:hypothetical protein
MAERIQKSKRIETELSVGLTKAQADALAVATEFQGLKPSVYCRGAILSRLVAEGWLKHPGFVKYPELEKNLEAERQAALADLAAHKANNDYAAASATVQSLANLQAEATNLKNLCDNYIASQQPRQPERLSDEEKAAKPIHRMNYDDVLDMARTSKYAKDLTWNADMQAGYDEVRARRSRGE